MNKKCIKLKLTEKEAYKLMEFIKPGAGKTNSVQIIEVFSKICRKLGYGLKDKNENNF